MKQLTALLISFLLFTNVNAQDQEAIKQDATKYFLTLKTKDVKASVDYLYPKLFDIAPREKVEAALKETFNDPSIELGFTNMVISKISNTITHENSKYALISYSYLMLIKPLDAIDKKTEKGLFKTYQDLFGKDNVVFDKDTKTYKISMVTGMYAIRSAEYNSWKFLENKIGMEAILLKLIPENVVEQLN